MDSDKYLEGQSTFARFNTIITSLKALDEGFSSKNYVRKFLRALHPKWRAKVTVIEESKDLSSLALRFHSLDEGFSSKNYVRKFLRALHPKWRAKVTVIEESKDLSSLALDKLIGNLKVHEVVMEKDSEIYRGKKERVKSISLRAKKESSDDETLTSRSDDEEYAMAKKL
ncbi:UBN2 domain-containing protein [Tanacetum coccineum]|uniref:UBN2 domain-containing protein n=1 Tax=Tanacetum coccineum TaxID=301880 RepID=A0ABQ5A2T9_9ASTR